MSEENFKIALRAFRQGNVLGGTFAALKDCAQVQCFDDRRRSVQAVHLNR